MITKRETNLSQLMIFFQVALTIAVFFSVEFLFPVQVFSALEKTAMLFQIVLIWGVLFNKFRLGIVFRTTSLQSMIRGYLVTIFFGALLLYIEVELLPFMRINKYAMEYLTLFAIIDLIALVLYKVLFYYAMKILRRKGYNSRKVIIIADTSAKPFVHSFVNAKDWGYKIVAIISPEKNLKMNFIKARTIFIQDKLNDFIIKNPVDDIFYCLPIDDKRFDADKLILDMEEIGVSVHIMQEDYLNNLNENKAKNRSFDNSFVTHSPVQHNYFSLKIKDFIDITFSVLVLFCLLPVMLLIALLIKLGDGGPIFFRQERIGLNGRRFICYKFRSMVVNAEDLITGLMDKNESDGPTFKIENDPRITKLGRILRKTSLDELPQFYNVIKSEMSVVGPRPPLLREVQQYERTQLRRLSMKPGITCIWQVKGRNEVSFEEWMRMDLEYIDNWSLWLDFKIVASTVGVILKANGR